MAKARSTRRRGFPRLQRTGIYVETDRGTLDVRLAADFSITPEIRLVLMDGDEDVLWMTPAAAKGLGQVASGGAEPTSIGCIRAVRVGWRGDATIEVVHGADMGHPALGWALVTCRSWPLADALALAARAVGFLVARSRLLNGLDEERDRAGAASAWAGLSEFYRGQFEAHDHEAEMCAVVIGRYRLDPDGEWWPNHPACLPVLPWPPGEAG